jgi:hypothetical protein
LVEAQVDEIYTSTGSKGKSAHVHMSRANERVNNFLPGLRGDIYTSNQSHLEQLLTGSDIIDTSGFFPSFYFPVEIRNEVRICSLFGSSHPIRHTCSHLLLNLQGPF